MLLPTHVTLNVFSMIFGFRKKCVVMKAPLLENVQPPGAFLNRNFTV
jgi:hypothetical protein